MRSTGPALLLALAVVVAACGSPTPTASDGRSSGTGGGTNAPSAGSASTQAPATGAMPSGEPGPGGDESPAAQTAGPDVESPRPTVEPTVESTVEPATEAPTDEPSPAPSTPDAATASAAACSGSDANRSFFAAAAAAVSWPVLCAVLPKGWFVADGSYRKAGGGKLLVSYKGPGGATIALSQGSFCSGDDGCVPAGGDVGDAVLGPLGGTLVGLDDGGFAIVVDRGMRPSWLMEARGLDQSTTVALGRAMAEVAD